MRNGWMSKLLGKYYSAESNRVLLTKRDRSIQRSVDLLAAMEEESSSGESLSQLTLDPNREEWRLPSASSFTRAKGIRKRTTPHLPQPDSSSSSEKRGTLFLFLLPEERIAPDRSTNLKPISDLLHGYKAHMDGDSGLPTTEETAEDSDG